MMHLLDRYCFKRDKPLDPVDFMHFTEKPEVKPLAPEEAYRKIDAEVWGI